MTMAYRAPGGFPCRRSDGLGLGRVREKGRGDRGGHGCVLTNGGEGQREEKKKRESMGEERWAGHYAGKKRRCLAGMRLIRIDG